MSINNSLKEFKNLEINRKNYKIFDKNTIEQVVSLVDSNKNILNYHPKTKPKNCSKPSVIILREKPIL